MDVWNRRAIIIQIVSYKGCSDTNGILYCVLRTDETEMKIFNGPNKVPMN